MQDNPFNRNENAENANDPLDGSNMQEDPLRQDEMCKMTPVTVQWWCFSYAFVLLVLVIVIYLAKTAF